MKHRWGIFYLCALLLIVVVIGFMGEGEAEGKESEPTVEDTIIPLASSYWDSTNIDLDGFDDVSLALDDEGTPHISYFARDEYGQIPPAIRYAVKQGNSWITEQVIEIQYQYSTSLVLDENNSPHITYGHLIGQSPEYSIQVSHAFMQGGMWSFKEVDIIQDICQGNYTETLLKDSAGALHLFYSFRYRLLNGECGYRLKYAKQIENGDWQVSTLLDSDIPLGFSVKIDSEDTFHLAFRSLSDGIYSLHYSKFRSVDQFSPVVIFSEQPGRSMSAISIALDNSNSSHIAVLANGTSGGYYPVYDLYMMHQEVNSWNIETTVKRRGHGSLASFIDTQGRAHITSNVIYGGSNVYAEHYYKTQDGWQEEEIALGPRSISIVPDQSDNIHAAIISVSNGTDAIATLRYLYKPSDLPMYSISGKVVTDSSTPLPGVTISAGGASTTTDANGNYVITGVPAGTYNVGPTLAGYAFTPATRSVTVSPNAAGVDFVATPQEAYSISGKVILGDGRPLEGVTVSAGAVSATTDANGTYFISGLGSGTYTISAEKDGYLISPSSKTVTIPPDATEQNFFVISDTDGDGLPNEWEANGYYYHGVFVDLPSLGAKVDHKDIFVYYDWLKEEGSSIIDQGHSHDPEGSLSLVVQAFANAPLDNPDGHTGINLHLMKGHMVPETEKYPVLGECVNESSYSWEEFDALKSGFPRELWLTFHYAVFAHNIISCDGKKIGGLSRNAEGDRSASDFIVALGDIEDGNSELIPPLGYDIDFQRAGTFMHELGHNLGLHHGGVKLDGEGQVIGPDDLNYKPNHLSVMNYLFQWNGLTKKNEFGVYTRGNMDYSRFTSAELPNLDENELREKAGLNATGEALNYQSRFLCPYRKEEPIRSHWIFGGIQGPVDWNCDDIISEVVAHDLTGNETTYDILATMNEWKYLVFDGGAIGATGDYPQLPLVTPEIKEMSYEEAEALAPEIKEIFLPTVVR